MSASVMYDFAAWQKFVFVWNYLGVCSIVCQKYFVSNYLANVLVNLGKISTKQNRNLTRNFHHPALIFNPALHSYFCIEGSHFLEFL